MKNISILGSTGSIGTQALSVVDAFPDEFNIISLSCFSDIELLEKQIEKYHPEMVAVMDTASAYTLEKHLQSRFPEIAVAAGIDGLIAAATCDKTDLLLTAVSGMIGLRPTLAAIEAGIDIALANKETLVAGGEIVMQAVKTRGVKLLPVDSEHSAIFQSLMGNEDNPIKRVIITASGGPFRGKSADFLHNVTPEQALNHPNWSMGPKITVDSSTLMNKGLEVIEARWLFDLQPEQINVAVHPQSIIHSLVEYQDRAVIAQLGLPDMALPIQVAFFYPKRMENTKPSLDLASIGKMTFEEPDRKNFRCLDLAYEALHSGGSMPAALNAANEMAVSRFLNNEIGYLDIARINESVMNQHQTIQTPSLEDILQTDEWARQIAKTL